MKKNSLMAIAIVLATFGSVSAQMVTSNVENTVNQNFVVKQLENLRFRVYFTDSVSGKVYIKIADDNGNILITENLNTAELKSRLYDLSNLLDGKYKISVESDKKVESQIVKIKTEISRSALVAINQ